MLPEAEARQQVAIAHLHLLLKIMAVPLALLVAMTDDFKLRAFRVVQATGPFFFFAIAGKDYRKLVTIGWCYGLFTMFRAIFLEAPTPLRFVTLQTTWALYLHVRVRESWASYGVYAGSLATAMFWAADFDPTAMSVIAAIQAAGVIAFLKKKEAIAATARDALAQEAATAALQSRAAAAVAAVAVQDAAAAQEAAEGAEAAAQRELERRLVAETQTQTERDVAAFLFHEFRADLQVIQTAIMCWCDGDDVKERLKKAARASVLHCKSLVDNVMDVTKPVAVRRNT